MRGKMSDEILGSFGASVNAMLRDERAVHREARGRREGARRLARNASVLLAARVLWAE